MSSLGHSVDFMAVKALMLPFAMLWLSLEPQKGENVRVLTVARGALLCKMASWSRTNSISRETGAGFLRGFTVGLCRVNDMYASYVSDGPEFV